MRQVQITVPNARVDEVVTLLRETYNVDQEICAQAGESTIIIVYEAAAIVGEMIKGLQEIGCGAKWGMIALVEVEAVVPQSALAAHGRDDLDIEVRLPVEEIYANIEAGSHLTFDYIAFVVIASTIAGLGLATNNSVMIVASMLVSPLMGPILAFTFGSVIADTRMVSLGVKNEAIGVLVTFLVGMVCGCVGIPFGHQLGWPTHQMMERGTIGSLVTGLAFAIPSGVGVGLSITSGGANALVGVAIAASLLPPVVNAGLCVTYAVVGPLMHKHVSSPLFIGVATISLQLFALNVAVIYLVGIIVFKMKAIVPVAKPSFWDDLHRVSSQAQHERPWNNDRRHALGRTGEQTPLLNP